MTYIQDCYQFYVQLIDQKATWQQYQQLLTSDQEEIPPLVYVKRIFQLSAFSYFIMMSAYLSETYPQIVKKILERFSGNQVLYVYIVSLYQQLQVITGSLLCEWIELEQQGVLFKKSGASLLQQNICLQPYVLYYLSSGCMLPVVGITCYSPQSIVYQPFYPQQQETLSYDLAQQEDIAIIGDSHTGRHTLLYQWCEQHHSAIILLQYALYQSLSYTEREAQLSYLHFYIQLQEAVFVLEEPVEADVTFWKTKLCIPSMVIITQHMLEGLSNSVTLPATLHITQTQQFIEQLLPASTMEIQEAMTPYECITFAQNCESPTTKLSMHYNTDCPLYVQVITSTVRMQDYYADQELKEQLSHMMYCINHPLQLQEYHIPNRQSMLFYGPSGTGKTMAASVIANETGSPLWRVDLSQVVDKYIGESEKHLREIFIKANKAHAILLFDEADVLFSKRTSITSSNDRYANTSTAYLLQLMENYEGCMILTSNLLNNFDQAFIRRLQYLIRFSLPKQEERYKKWKQCFQKIALDVTFPLLRIAEEFPLSLAQIELISHQAIAYWLSSAAQQFTIHHMMQALQQEYQKMQKAIHPDILSYFTSYQSIK